MTKVRVSIPDQRCPYCLKLLGPCYSTEPEDGDPRVMPIPGDASICYYCYSACQFGADLKLVQWPEGEPFPEGLEEGRRLIREQRDQSEKHAYAN